MVIVKKNTIGAPMEKVFAALTDPYQLPQWWGDGVDRWESDLRIGGRWASYGTLADGSNFCVKGIYRIVQPQKLVEMTCQHWGHDVPETIFRYELMETGGKTHLRVTHSGFPSKQFRDGHSHGWDQTLARLVGFVAGTPS
jgi:uncharacterized protein YndB with AHSA1/START domain